MREQVAELKDMQESQKEQNKVLNSEKAYLKKAYDGVSKKLKDLNEKNFLVPKELGNQTTNKKSVSGANPSNEDPLV